MRSTLLLLFLLLVPTQTAAQQNLECMKQKGNILECQERQWREYLGKYLCLIDHVAGIQYDNDEGRGQPYVGSIRPTEDKFFMEITEDSSHTCGDFLDVLSSVDTKDCTTKYKMTVKSKNIFLRENGYSALLPQIFATLGGKMVIVLGGRFNGNYRWGWDNYAFEGR